MKIVYLDSYALNPGDLSWDALQAIGEVVLYKTTAPEEVYGRICDADVVVVNKVLLGADLLTALPRLKLIAVTATGVNNVDLDAARSSGIDVCNVPAYSTMSVVQMIFAHIFHHTNNIAQHSESVADGAWETSKQFCFWQSEQIEIAEKTLGIVGFGNIGYALAKVALAFGMKVIVLSRSQRETDLAISYVTKEQLFAESDYVSLCCALTEETKGIINRDTLRLMKSSAMVINTGRGPLIEESALVEALEEEKIAAAGIDVLSQEPPRDGSPLIGAKNCTVTPHIAWATKEARTRALAITVENIAGYLAQKPLNIVN